MKKNKGFTLIELLAVIVILGILLVVVGTNAIKSKKAANDSELQKQAQMLADLAAGIYSHEKTMNPNGTFMQNYGSNNLYISQQTLIDSGYLDGKIKSPYTGKECDESGDKIYLIVKADGTYDSYIKCGNQSAACVTGTCDDPSDPSDPSVSYTSISSLN